ncbi:MAG TPA: hypothetical protein D7H89_07970 [Candidatus Poseidoniales archaeon]|nr:MAG TPA: hypothetical protein D7H89_07970 [Candidatus Poseidoniales archaeon]
MGRWIDYPPPFHAALDSSKAAAKELLGQTWPLALRNGAVDTKRRHSHEKKQLWSRWRQQAKQGDEVPNSR